MFFWDGNVESLQVRALDMRGEGIEFDVRFN